MLTQEELSIVYSICLSWPGGLGCILLPSRRSKRGYKNANWGWKGRMYGDFDYSKIPAIEKQPGVIFCPVTAVGLCRDAKNFHDHMQAYKSIRSTFMAATGYDEKTAKKQYNFLLSRQPKTLSQVFRCYAENEKIESCPLSEITGGYFVHLHNISEGHEIISLAYVSWSENSYIETIDGKTFDRRGKSEISKDYITSF